MKAMPVFDLKELKKWRAIKLIEEERKKKKHRKKKRKEKEAEIPVPLEKLMKRFKAIEEKAFIRKEDNKEKQRERYKQLQKHADVFSEAYTKALATRRIEVPLPDLKQWLRYKAFEIKSQMPSSVVGELERSKAFEKKLVEKKKGPVEVYIKSPHLREELGLVKVPSYGKQYEELVFTPARGWTEIEMTLRKAARKAKAEGRTLEAAGLSTAASTAAFLQGFTAATMAHAAPWVIAEGYKELILHPKETLSRMAKRIRENPLEISRLAGQLAGAYFVGKLVSATMPRTPKQVEFYPRESVRLVKLEPPDKVMYVKVQRGPLEILKPGAKMTSYPDWLALKHIKPGMEVVKPYPRYMTFIRKPLEILWKGKYEKPGMVAKTLGKVKYDVKAGESYALIMGDVVKQLPSAVKNVFKKLANKLGIKKTVDLKGGEYLRYDIYAVKSPEIYGQVVKEVILKGKPLTEEFKPIIKQVPKEFGEVVKDVYIVPEEPSALAQLKALAQKVPEVPRPSVHVTAVPPVPETLGSLAGISLSVPRAEEKAEEKVEEKTVEKTFPSEVKTSAGLGLILIPKEEDLRKSVPRIKTKTPKGPIVSPKEGIKVEPKTTYPQPVPEFEREKVKTRPRLEPKPTVPRPTPLYPSLELKHEIPGLKEIEKELPILPPSIKELSELEKIKFIKKMATKITPKMLKLVGIRRKPKIRGIEDIEEFVKIKPKFFVREKPEVLEEPERVIPVAVTVPKRIRETTPPPTHVPEPEIIVPPTEETAQKEKTTEEEAVAQPEMMPPLGGHGRPIIPGVVFGPGLPYISRAVSGVTVYSRMKPYQYEEIKL